MRAIVLSLLLLVSTGLPAGAQHAVYLIRHAEKALTGTDPALTPEGRQRAADWAEMMRHAGLDAIITSEAMRTRETGAIIGAALGLPQTALPGADITGLVSVLEFDHAAETVLVVGHSNTIPLILDRLGAPNDITIEEDDFANLYVLTRPLSDDPVLIRLRMP